MLDEPTAALDLRHQEDVLTVARESARAGAVVVVVVHDLSLAAAYADQVAILDKGSLVSLGAPEEVLTEGSLGAVYGIDVRVIADEAGHLIVPRRPHRS